MANRNPTESRASTFRAATDCKLWVGLALLVCVGCSASAESDTQPDSGAVSQPLRAVDRDALRELDREDVEEVAAVVETFADIVAKHGGSVEIVLNFSDTGLTDEDLATMVFPDTVHGIDLSRTKITDAGLAHLARARNLQRVFLNETGVTDAGLEELKNLPHLTVAHLDRCSQVTREGRMGLVRLFASRQQGTWEADRVKAQNR